MPWQLRSPTTDCEPEALGCDAGSVNPSTWEGPRQGSDGVTRPRARSMQAAPRQPWGPKAEHVLVPGSWRLLLPATLRAAPCSQSPQTGMSILLEASQTPRVMLSDTQTRQHRVSQVEI